MSAWIRNVGIAALLIAATIVAYSVTWSRAGYVYEDIPAAIQSDAVVGPPPAGAGAPSAIAPTNGIFVIRDITGGDLRKTHALMVLVHCLNGMLVGVIAFALGAKRWWWVAAAVFLLHPVQTESVSYMATQANMVSTTWVLAACALVAAPIGWGRVIALLPAFVAMKVKADAVVVAPLMLLTMLHTVKRRIPVPLLALGAACVASFGWGLYLITPNPWTASVDYSRLQYTAGQLMSAVALAAVTVFPIIRLRVDADMWPFVAEVTPGMYFMLVGPALVVLAFTVAMWNRRRDPLTFAVLWVALCLAPRFIVHLSEWITEYHWYRPMAGIAVAAALAVNAYCARAAARGKIGVPVKHYDYPAYEDYLSL